MLRMLLMPNWTEKPTAPRAITAPVAIPKPIASMIRLTVPSPYARRGSRGRDDPGRDSPWADE